MGASVAQWLKRSSLSFFAAPLVAFVWAIPVGWLASFDPTFTNYLWFALPVWWYSSWRLTRWTMEGRHGPEVLVRGVAHALLALGVFYLAVFAHRTLTLPPAMPEWRSKILAMELPRATQEELVRDGEVLTFQFVQGAYDRQHYQTHVYSSFEEVKGRLEDELADDHFAGEHVTMDVLVGLTLNQSTRYGGPRRLNRLGNLTVSLDEFQELRRLAIQVQLKWDRVVREHWKFGYPLLWQLLEIAEPSEQYAVQTLNDIAVEQNLFDSNVTPANSEQDRLDREAFVRLVEMIPSAELRKQSRRVFVIREWKKFQEQVWELDLKQPPSGPWQHRKQFGSIFWWDRRYRFRFEQVRIERYLDSATKITLDQLENGLPRWSGEEHQKVYLAWQNAFSPSFRSELADEVGVGRLQGAPIFPLNYEEDIARLREAQARLLESQ